MKKLYFLFFLMSAYVYPMDYKDHEFPYENKWNYKSLIEKIKKVKNTHPVVLANSAMATACALGIAADIIYFGTGVLFAGCVVEGGISLLNARIIQNQVDWLYRLEGLTQAGSLNEDELQRERSDLKAQYDDGDLRGFAEVVNGLESFVAGAVAINYGGANKPNAFVAKWAAALSLFHLSDIVVMEKNAYAINKKVKILSELNSQP